MGLRKASPIFFELVWMFSVCYFIFKKNNKLYLIPFWSNMLVPVSSDKSSYLLYWTVSESHWRLKKCELCLIMLCDMWCNWQFYWFFFFCICVMHTFSCNLLSLEVITKSTALLGWTNLIFPRWVLNFIFFKKKENIFEPWLESYKARVYSNTSERSLFEMYKK